MTEYCCKEILVGGRIARVSIDLPSRGWSLDRAGYLIWTSRRKKNPIRRGMKAHRMVFLLLGFDLTSDIEIHHQDHNKLNCCPLNLIAMPGCMNPSGALRDPYTGEFLSLDQYQRRYGYDWKRVA